MAEQIISPGVFTRENDLSFLPQGIGATEKRPAFVPTVVRSFSEFERRFGPLSSTTYVPQTVREYLKNAGSVTVCRVLAGSGYTLANGTNECILLVASGSEKSGDVKDDMILGAIFPSQNLSTPDLSTSTIEGKDSPGNSKNGTNEYAGTPGYTYVNFKEFQTSVLGSTVDTVEKSRLVFGAPASTIMTSSLRSRYQSQGASGSFYVSIET